MQTRLIKDSFNAFWSDTKDLLLRPDADEGEVERVRETIEIVFNNGAISVYVLMTHGKNNKRQMRGLAKEVEDLLNGDAEKPKQKSDV